MNTKTAQQRVIELVICSYRVYWHGFALHQSWIWCSTVVVNCWEWGWMLI